MTDPNADLTKRMWRHLGVRSSGEPLGSEVLAQIDVPLRAQPGLVKVVDHVPECSFCERPGIFDFVVMDGVWANGCLKHYLMHRVSSKLGVGRAQLWITSDQVGLTQLPGR